MKRFLTSVFAAFVMMQGASAAAPVNDMFAQRVQIAPVDLPAAGSVKVIQGSLIDATIELGEPSFSLQSPGQYSVWYSYKAEKTGIHVFALLPAGGTERSSLQLEIYSGTNIRNLKNIGKASGAMAQLPFIPYNLIAGRTYVLRVSTSASYPSLDDAFSLVVRNSGPNGGLVIVTAHALDRTVVDQVIDAGIGYEPAYFFAINTSQKSVTANMSNVHLTQFGRYSGTPYWGKTVTFPAATLGSNATAGWAMLSSSVIDGPSVATTAIPVTLRYGASRATARYQIVSRTANPTTTLEASFPKITNPVRIPYGTTRNVGLEVRNTGFRDAVGCRLVGFRRPGDIYGENYSAELRWKVGTNAASPTFEVPAGGKRTLTVMLRPLWPGILYPAVRIILNCANTGAGTYRPATANAIEIDAR